MEDPRTCSPMLRIIALMTLNTHIHLKIRTLSAWMSYKKQRNMLSKTTWEYEGSIKHNLSGAIEMQQEFLWPKWRKKEWNSFNATDLITLLRGFIGTKQQDFSLGSDYVLCIQCGGHCRLAHLRGSDSWRVQESLRVCADALRRSTIQQRMRRARPR